MNSSRVSWVRKARVSQQEKTTIVCGGGMAGLIFALGTKLMDPSIRVVVVDPSKEWGGSFSSFAAENGWLFDRGMHLVPKVGAEPFDRFFNNNEIFHAGFWNELSSENRDRGGRVQDGKVITGSPFPSFPPSESNKSASRILSWDFRSSSGRPMDRCKTVAEYLRENFGEDFLIHHSQFFEILFGLPADRLHPSVLNLVPYKRVQIEDPDLSRELSGKDEFSFRIGSDASVRARGQVADLPPNLYPATAGIGQFTEKLVTWLSNEGVEFLSMSSVSRIHTSSEGEIEGVTIVGAKTETLFQVDHLVWTAPLHALNNLLLKSKLPADWIPALAPPRRFLRFIHFVSLTPIFDNGAYYLFDLDPNPVFRLTSYSAFSRHPGGFAYTLEVSTLDRAAGRDLPSARREVTEFLARISIDPDEIVELWTDPVVLPLPGPPAHLQNPKPIVPTRLSSSLSLFGSSRQLEFGLTKDLYGQFLEVFEG